MEGQEQQVLLLQELALGVDASGTRNTTDEIIQDVVGAMFTSSNTETGITATYDDTDGTMV